MTQLREQSEDIALAYEGLAVEYSRAEIEREIMGLKIIKLSARPACQLESPNTASNSAPKIPTDLPTRFSAIVPIYRNPGAVPYYA